MNEAERWTRGWMNERVRLRRKILSRVKECAWPWTDSRSRLRHIERRHGEIRCIYLLQVDDTRPELAASSTGLMHVLRAILVNTQRRDITREINKSSYV